MSKVLNKLREDPEIQAIYRFFKKFYILLKNPPKNPQIKITKKLLLSVMDENLVSEEILLDFNNMLRAKHNYKEFESHKVVDSLHEKFTNSESNTQKLTIGHMVSVADDTFVMGKLMTHNIRNFPLSIDGMGKTPLHRASECHKFKAIDIILNADQSRISNFINIQDNNGQTALHIAVTKNQAIVISRLINKGADINITDSSGYKPIHNALLNRYKPVVKLLEEEGADINEPVNGQPLIMLAYENNNKQLVNFLVNMKVNISGSYNGGTFIGMICKDKNISLLKKVIKQYIICNLDFLKTNTAQLKSEDDLISCYLTPNQIIDAMKPSSELLGIEDDEQI